jgi:hypothetical protein
VVPTRAAVDRAAELALRPPVLSPSSLLPKFITAFAFSSRFS